MTSNTTAFRSLYCRMSLRITPLALPARLVLFAGLAYCAVTRPRQDVTCTTPVWEGPSLESRFSAFFGIEYTSYALLMESALRE